MSIVDGCECVCSECLRYGRKTHTVCIYSCALKERTTRYVPESATPMPGAEPECGHDEEMAEAGARVEMLDSVCKWLAGHGYKPAADEVFAERGRWFYPQHPQHWRRDEEHLARERAAPSSGPDEAATEKAVLAINTWLSIGARITSKGDQLKCCTPDSEGGTEKTWLDAEECRELSEAFATLAGQFTRKAGEP